MGWVSCSEHIPQRTVVCRHKSTRSHGVPRRSPRIDRACDNKGQQLPGVFRPSSSKAAHSPPLHSQSTAQNSGLPSARPRQDPIALPLQWSARSARSFLASALDSVITKRRPLALAAVGARTSLILPSRAAASDRAHDRSSRAAHCSSFHHPSPRTPTRRSPRSPFTHARGAVCADSEHP